MGVSTWASASDRMGFKSHLCCSLPRYFGASEWSSGPKPQFLIHQMGIIEVPPHRTVTTINLFCVESLPGLQCSVSTDCSNWQKENVLGTS